MELILVERVPRWAELLFKTNCTKSGAVATEPDVDANGWDYLVEFPDESYQGPAESTPATRNAFVQIKSTVGRKLSAKVKLSNMLSSSSSPAPWFVVLILADGRIYGRTVLDDLLGDSLKAIRRARLAGKQLHKTFLILNFTEAHRIEGDVVGWMRQRIGQSAADYAGLKRTQFESIGYENGTGRGSFTVAIDDADTIGRNFLGLGDGLDLMSFNYSDTRFGIAEPLVQVVGAARLTINPMPIGTCQVRVKSPSTEPSLKLRGKVYGFGPPQVTSIVRQTRISAPPLEIIIKDGLYGNCSIKCEPSQTYSLKYFHDLLTMLRWSRRSDSRLNVEIVRPGNSPFPITFDLKLEAGNAGVEKILDALASVVDPTEHGQFEFSLSELQRSYTELLLFSLLIVEDSLHLKAIDGAICETPFQSVLYSVDAKLSDWHLSAIVSRPVQKRKAGRVAISTANLGASVLHEISVTRHAPDREIREQEFSDIAAGIGENQDVLIVHDMLESFLRNPPWIGETSVDD